MNKNEINVNDLDEEELSQLVKKLEFTEPQKKKLFTRIITDKKLDLVLAGKGGVYRFVNTKKKKQNKLAPNIQMKHEKNKEKAKC